MINSRQFLHYIRLLRHPDTRQRIDTLQDMFFLLLRGELLHPNQWEQLIPILVSNIAYSNDDTLRRWGYQVGTFSINNNKLLVDYCINNLGKESDPENRSWMVALLSKNLPKQEFHKVLSENDHRLTYENISLATYLFTDYSTVNVSRALKKSDPLSLMWIASIGAYKNIAHHNKREELVTPNDLSKLTGETNDDEVLKHVMYAFFLQETFNIHELQFSPFDYEKMGSQQKKWFFSLIWKDDNFLLDNIDFFRSLLSEKHLFCEIGPEIRIGLARGLADSRFSKEISNSIIEWYSHEDSQSVLYYLLKYFQQYQHLSEQYKEIVEFQRENGREPLKELISVNEKSIIVPNEAELLFQRILKGDGKMEIKIENSGQGQVNVFDGNNNQAIYTTSGTIKWESIKDELEEILQKCKDDEKKHELEEAMNALAERDESKFMAALRRVVQFGSDVFSNVTANVLIAYMRANGIIP